MKNRLNVISILLFVAGFMFAVGTVGAADLELIEFKTLLYRGVISVIIMSAGYGLGKIGGNYENWR